MLSRVLALLSCAAWLGACASTAQVPDGERTRPALVFEVDESVVIARDTDVVFAFVADYRNDAVWRSEVVSMDTDPEAAPAIGTRTTEVAHVLGEDLTTVTEVIHYEEGRQITARTVAGAPLWLSSERTCEAVEGGTRFRYRVRAENNTAYPTAALALGYGGIVRGYLRALKAALEQADEEGPDVAASAASSGP